MNFGTLQSLIAKEYMKVLYDNIFVRSHYLLAKLKSKAKTFNGRRISVPVEGGTAGDVNWGSWHGIGSNIKHATAGIGASVPNDPDVQKAGYRDLPFSYTDPFTLAEYVPKMLTGTLAITKEETLMMNSKQAIANIVTAKVKNLQKVIEQKLLITYTTEELLKILKNGIALSRLLMLLLFLVDLTLHMVVSDSNGGKAELLMQAH